MGHSESSDVRQKTIMRARHVDAIPFIAEDLDVLKNDVAVLKTDVKNIKNDISEIKSILSHKWFHKFLRTTLESISYLPSLAHCDRSAPKSPNQNRHAIMLCSAHLHCLSTTLSQLIHATLPTSVW